MQVVTWTAALNWGLALGTLGFIIGFMMLMIFDSDAMHSRMSKADRLANIGVAVAIVSAFVLAIIGFINTAIWIF